MNVWTGGKKRCVVNKIVFGFVNHMNLLLLLLYKHKKRKKIMIEYHKYPLMSNQTNPGSSSLNGLGENQFFL